MQQLTPTALQAALFSNIGDRTAAARAALSALGGGQALARTPLTAEPMFRTPESSGGYGGSSAVPLSASGSPNKARLIEAARRAGFTGQALQVAVAIAMAESGGRENARGVNSDRRRTVDRGPWQINSHWHREVPDSEAYNYDAAARHAFRISGGGRNWSPWTTYKTGAYRQYI